MPRNDGKVIERNIGKALTNILGKEAVAVRLHDTKSAAFFLPPAPADFIGLFKGGIPVLIEAKSSDDKLSFLDCRVKDYVQPTQFAYHKLWLKMGGLSAFLFHSILTDTVEYWDGDVILDAYVNKWSAAQETLGCPQTSGHTVAEIQKTLPLFVSRTHDSIKEKQ